MIMWAARKIIFGIILSKITLLCVTKDIDSIAAVHTPHKKRQARDGDILALAKSRKQNGSIFTEWT